MKLSSLIGHSAEALELIFADPRPADLVINHFFRGRKYLGSRDRAYIAEAVYHALRNRRRLEWLCDRFLDTKMRKAPPPAVRSLMVFVFSILEDASQQEAEEVAAALAERESLAGSQSSSSSSSSSFSSSSSLTSRSAAATTFIAGGADFVRAAREFLDCADRLPWPSDPTARLALEYSLPDWLAQRLVEMLGPKDAARLAATTNQPAPVTLRVNALKAPREAVQAALAAEGHPCDPTPLSPFGLTLRARANVFTTDAFKRGWFEIQDEGSQLVSLCADPKPGARVLDACAGGGGKALHLSALMKGRGEIVALDIFKRRLDSLRDRARRADCQNIRVRLVGADEAPAADLVGRMDCVLIDAPCTGIGVLRRNPDARWKTTPQSVLELAARQRELLARYAACVAPGGRLVYATCSLLREENEAVIEDFLRDRGEFRSGDARAQLVRYGLERLAPDGGPYLRLWPHRHGTDGFFVTVLERTK